MQILLLGKNGQLGWEAARTLACLGNVTALDYPEIDFSRPTQLQALVDDIKPDVIYNAAAYTLVDQAESQPELCRLINTEAPAVLAGAARKHRSLLIHFSTDYVFDGSKGAPYVEDDAPHPLNLYGQSKLDSEKAVLQNGECSLIFRTSWVYSLRGNSFVAKVQQWASQQANLRIVSDQISGPTWARMLAECTTLLISSVLPAPFDALKNRQGIYHLAGDGFASRQQWAQEILRLTTPANKPLTQVLPAATVDFPTPAVRPLFSALDCGKFKTVFNLALPDWKTSLNLALQG